MFVADWIRVAPLVLGVAWIGAAFEGPAFAAPKGRSKVEAATPTPDPRKEGLVGAVLAFNVSMGEVDLQDWVNSSDLVRAEMDRVGITFVFLEEDQFLSGWKYRIGKKRYVVPASKLAGKTSTGYVFVKGASKPLVVSHDLPEIVLRKAQEYFRVDLGR